MTKPFKLAMQVGLLISLTWASAPERPRQFELKGESGKLWDLVPKDAKLATGRCTSSRRGRQVSCPIWQNEVFGIAI